MYLALEGYFSLNINLRFCEVKFKPFGHLFLYGGFLLQLLIIHLLTVLEISSPLVISYSDLKGFSCFVGAFYWLGFSFLPTPLLLKNLRVFYCTLQEIEWILNC